MDAYSQDLRERVARACDAGEMTQPEVAEAFGVSLSFITKLLRRRRETGSLEALPHGGGPAPKLNQTHENRVRGWVQEQPDATLAELCQRLVSSHGPQVSLNTMCRVLGKLGLVRKKRACMPPSGKRRV